MSLRLGLAALALALGVSSCASMQNNSVWQSSVNFSDADALKRIHGAAEAKTRYELKFGTDQMYRFLEWEFDLMSLLRYDLEFEKVTNVRECIGDRHVLDRIKNLGYENMANLIVSDKLAYVRNDGNICIEGTLYAVTSKVNDPSKSRNVFE
ncbi:hypothetical protein JW711_01840 [Candidatus Woesearchaeota archaeon]|nr:hypothetical protein [Candidatus Woesearchaeota archaeon]